MDYEDLNEVVDDVVGHLKGISKGISMLTWLVGFLLLATLATHYGWW